MKNLKSGIAYNLLVKTESDILALKEIVDSGERTLFLNPMMKEKYGLTKVEAINLKDSKNLEDLSVEFMMHMIMTDDVPDAAKEAMLDSNKIIVYEVLYEDAETTQLTAGHSISISLDEKGNEFDISEQRQKWISEKLKTTNIFGNPVTSIIHHHVNDETSINFLVNEIASKKDNEIIYFMCGGVQAAGFAQIESFGNDNCIKPITDSECLAIMNKLEKSFGEDYEFKFGDKFGKLYFWSLENGSNYEYEVPIQADVIIARCTMPQ
jgi:hypothetical protein